MVFSSEEIAIGREIAASLQNSSQAIMDGASQAGTYAFEIMVKGTMVSGAASLICGIFSLVAMYYVVRKIIAWTRGMVESEGDDAWFLGVFGSIVACVVILVTTWSVFYNSITAILAPEYVVIMKFIEIAIPAVT